MERGSWMWKERPAIDLRAFVAVASILLFGVIIAMLLFRPMPMTEAAGALLTALVGVVATKYSTIVDFYFGSNKDSKDKDETIRQQAQSASSTAATVTSIAAASAAGASSASAGLVNGAAEAAAWATATTANTIVGFQAYLDQFPAGVHAADAMGSIASLRAAEPPR